MPFGRTAKWRAQKIMWYKSALSCETKQVSPYKGVRKRQYARACLFWSNMKRSLECGPVSPAAKARRGWPWAGKAQGYLALSQMTYLHLYILINILCILKCGICGPLTCPGGNHRLTSWQVYPWPPFMAVLGTLHHTFPVSENTENWFLSFTFLSAQSLCGQEICLPCQWFWGTINNAGWFSNKQPFEGV